MLDILIKSYNRAYYLDRCIYSIKKFVTDKNYNIVILDDGTPQVYLDKILTKYPELSIHKSEAYIEKSAAAVVGKQPSSNKIPIDLWIEGAKNASDYFLLLEDDIWFTKDIDLTSVIKNMVSNKCVFTKLFWLRNKDLIQSKKDQIVETINYVIPKLPFKNSTLFWFFFKVDRFKIHKLSKLFKIYTIKKKNSYYSIYSVAGVIFKKDYFLQLWKNHRNTVDEKLQIHNALKFIKKNDISFARTKNEYLKTGFISSATNKSFIDVQCDMHQLNAILNNLWFTEKFNTCDNLQKDFSIKTVNDLLNNNMNSNEIEIWKNWSQSFKNHFQKIGCNLD